MTIIKYKTRKYPLSRTFTTDAGFDIRAVLEHSIFLHPNKSVSIGTGIYLNIPPGLQGEIRSRSGLAFGYKITLLNGVGTIDSGYIGEIKVLLFNFGDDSFLIEDGMKIAQIVFAKVELIKLSNVAAFDDLTERGERGFGSSGLI